jgi:hypothetical protein
MNEVRMTRSGRKHGITATRVAEVLQNAGEPTVIGDKLEYIGKDARGTELEIVLIEDPANKAHFAVIHAMPTEWKSKKGQQQ